MNQSRRARAEVDLTNERHADGVAVAVGSGASDELSTSPWHLPGAMPIMAT